MNKYEEKLNELYQCFKECSTRSGDNCCVSCHYYCDCYVSDESIIDFFDNENDANAFLKLLVNVFEKGDCTSHYEKKIQELEKHKEIKNEALKNCENRIVKLTKALNNACDYIHNDGVDGCPYRYDIITIDMEKQKECDMCDFNFINYYDDETNNCEYQNKSIKCWKEYFMKMVKKND